MKANFVEWDCPQCGKKNREACGTWIYGSPIRNCKYCSTEYLDKRWREVAIDGYDPRTSNSSFYLKGTLGFGALALIALLVMMFTITTRGYYHTTNVLILFGGVLGAVLCLIMFLRIKFGFEAKSQQKYLDESISRLKDPEYVKKLMDYGYTIPSEYDPTGSLGISVDSQ